MGGFKSGPGGVATDLEVTATADYPAPAIRTDGSIIDTMVLNIVNTDGNLTITVAQLIAAALARGSDNGITAHRTDITPTAAQIVAAIPGCIATQRFKFKYCNFDATHNIILDLGTGVTNYAADGTATFTVTPGKARNFLFRVTNVGSGSEAITILPDGDAYTITS